MTDNVQIDATEIGSAMRELRALLGAGDHVPNHLALKLLRLIEGVDGFELVREGGRLLAVPSPDLIAVIATLRAHEAAHAGEAP
jgi:hypothetical protein